MATYFVRTDGSDSHDGSANDAAHAFLTVAHAVSAAANGDTINAVTGPFAEGNVVLDLAAKNLTLIGIGATPVELTFTASESSAQPGGAFLNGGFVTNIYSHGVVDNSSTATFQSPAGWQGKAPTSQTAWTTASYSGCHLKSDVDGLFLSSPDNAQTFTCTLRSCILESTFDTVNLNGSTFSAWPGAFVEIYDSTLTVTGPTPATFASHVYRGANAYNGKIRMFGGSISVASNDSNGTSVVRGVSGPTGVGTTKPRIELIGVTITTSSLAGSEAAVEQAGSGKICLSNCTYDTNKVIGSPSVVTVAGSVRGSHTPGTNYSGTFTNGANTAFDGMKVNGQAVTATVSGGSFSWSIPANYTQSSNLLVELTDSAANESAAIDLIAVAVVGNMSLILSLEIRVGGVLTDADAPPTLSDPTNTFGVRRADTLAVVVAAGKLFSHDGTGLYSYALDGSDADHPLALAGVTYEYWPHFTVAGTPLNYQQTKTATAVIGIYADGDDLSDWYGASNIDIYSNLDNATAIRDEARVQKFLTKADDKINLAFKRAGRTTPIPNTEADFSALSDIAAEWAGAMLAMSRGGMPEGAGFSTQDEFEKVMGWHIKHAMDELTKLVTDWENTQTDNVVSQAGTFVQVPMESTTCTAFIEENAQ